MITMLSTIALLGGASITQFEAQASDVEVVVTEKSEVVNIPDEALYRAISRELGRGWDDEDPITIEDMSCLEELVIYDNISELTGIEYAVNLRKLRIFGDEQATNVLDLSPIQGLTNLEGLFLHTPQVHDITALSNLINLSILYMGGDNIQDLDALSNLKNLENIQIWDTHLTDINGLRDLTNLIELSIEGDSLKDISPLAKLHNLKSLRLEGNAISDVTPLSNLNNLESIDLSDNDISNINLISIPNNVYSLNLSNNNISNINLDSNLNNLEYLDLSGNNISDINSLKYLKNLMALDLSNNKISNIDVISQLEGLSDLDLSNNLISDITPLASFNSERLDEWTIVILNLDNNMISDVSPLQVIELTNRGVGPMRNIYFSIKNQKIELTASLQNQMLEISNPIKGLNSIQKMNIKTNGVYDSSKDTLSWDGLNAGDKVNFTFEQVSDTGGSVGNIYYYSGQVTITASDSPAVGWYQIDNQWYYMNNSGYNHIGWLQEGSTWYYLKSSGAMATGWEKVNGTWYYFNGSGKMQTGWLQE
ncbi:leucine-rich repeat domain-containing protein, partial [Turicibacter bilis]|uniref:leucine-rich repeat domain-containing protein n=1 Tax=Turicibacter bilis TaxID=2735723 RepID=UPI0031BAA9F3